MIKTDLHNRRFKKLRVSLTPECNYSCLYCAETKASFAKAGVNLSRPGGVLPLSDLLQMIRNLHSELDLTTVRLTGGEPMLYPDLVEVVAALKDLKIPKVAMTTNGHLYYRKAQQLRDAGLTSVNISLDALDDRAFRKMSRTDGLNNVLKSVDAALACGMEVKLNTVVLNNLNSGEIIPLLNYAMSKGVFIRFLELMPMGSLHHSYKEFFYSESQMLNAISEVYEIESLPREKNSTANYWAINGQKAFGIIANESSPFCGDCDRLRLDSKGQIYGCLSSMQAIRIRANMPSAQLTDALSQALTHKQEYNFSGNKHTMQSIGG